MATVRKQAIPSDHDGPLSIATEIHEVAHLRDGDAVLVEAADGGVLIRHIDPEQAGFWTAEWLEGEREIDEEIARRETGAVHASTQKFLAHLHSGAPADEA